MHNVLYIDCSIAGISGDMLLSALVDIGANKEVIINEISKVTKNIMNINDFYIDFIEKESGECRGKKLVIETKETVEERSGKEILSIVEEYKRISSLSKTAIMKIDEIFRTLLEAEAKVHGKTNEEVHLHESGSIDTFVDIIGSIAALDSLNIFEEGKIISSPVAVGGGMIKFSHRISSVPAPATLQILTDRRFPLKGGPVEHELTTPTGAAIIVNITKEVSNYLPLIKPVKVGIGIGNIKDENFADLLRVILGEPYEEKYYYNDRVMMIETNVDDVDGETLGYLIEKLNKEGVKDVTLVPAITKKNRPSFIISVICDYSDYINVVKTIFNETGTLGVRIKECNRIVRERKIEEAKVKVGEREYCIRIKVSKDMNGKILTIKPEFEDLKRISSELSLPLREVKKKVDEEIESKIKEQLE